jgi:hypothetical protein
LASYRHLHGLVRSKEPRSFFSVGLSFLPLLKGILQNLDENHSRSAGRVTSPVNFAPSRPDFSLPLTPEILSTLKNRYVIIGGSLAFCLLPTARYEWQKDLVASVAFGKKRVDFRWRDCFRPDCLPGMERLLDAEGQRFVSAPASRRKDQGHGGSGR